MIQPNLLHRFDTFNRILTCKDTFLVQIGREALELALLELPELAPDDNLNA